MDSCVMDPVLTLALAEMRTLLPLIVEPDAGDVKLTDGVGSAVGYHCAFDATGLQVYTISCVPLLVLLPGSLIHPSL
jgi:hypothetical protein